MQARSELDRIAVSEGSASGQMPVGDPAIRFLVENALETVMHSESKVDIGERDEWIAQLGEAVMANPDSAHHAVVSSLFAKGVKSSELYQHFIPEASRYIGAKWVRDEASFVDVTTGSARLQALFRDRPEQTSLSSATDTRDPADPSMLMVIPDFEQHSLGAFVAADHLQRHGIWTRMAIGLKMAELEELLTTHRFTLIGISLATQKSVRAAAGMIQRMRNCTDQLPPIVVGGRVVEDRSEITQCTRADYVVNSPHEVLQICDRNAKARLTCFEKAG